MTTQNKTDLAVVVGRFQPFHQGHLALLSHALDAADHVVVVIGSAYQARTPRNPFTWQERADMISRSLPEPQRDRVSFLPIRDWFDEQKWQAAVRTGVERLAQMRLTRRVPTITLIGHLKDETSTYLEHFDGWHFLAIPRHCPTDATHIRDTYFGGEGAALETALASLKDAVPEASRRFLITWAKSPEYAAICQEWRMLQAYQRAWSAAPYPPVFVTVDAVVRCADKVLLIQRGQPPGVGLYAVPGGFIEQRETACQSALRELREETRLEVPESDMKAALRGQAVFDHPDRSQRGRTITHAFYFDLGQRPLPTVRADDDARSAEWIDIAQIPKMEDRFHDDHFHMLDHFLVLI
jgi:bifunctional NMN adenylyltransferase/nudix hydrolase